MEKNKYLYGTLTWPEVNEVVRQGRVAIVPIGTIEDHGYHLPIETDNIIAWEVGKRAAEKIPEDVVLLPLVPYGINYHHFDFPGAIDIPGDVFIAFLMGITKSLAYHGFRKIILLNAHGSNKHYVGIAARRTVLETNALCVATTPLMLTGPEMVKKIRKSGPGGISHACEQETALLLHICPELVQMDKAVKEYSLQKSEFYGIDVGKTKVEFMDWWSRMSESGVVGDPTTADEETGKAFLDVAVDNLVAFIHEYRHWEIKERKDHH